MSNEEFIEKAKQLVREYTMDYLDKTDALKLKRKSKVMYKCQKRKGDQALTI